MRIVFCLNHFLPDQVAGTEIYTLELAKGLKETGHAVLVLVPGFGHDEDFHYRLGEIDVMRYAEPQVVDRAFLQSRKAPLGIVSFLRIIAQFGPDIVHFQEVTASSGISVFHIKAVKAKGIKTLMTFHLAGHSCYTGTLVYRNKQLCDGAIDIRRCTRCSYASKPVPEVGRYLLSGTANLLHWMGYDTRRWQSRIGTAFSFPFLVEELKASLMELSDACDHLVSITNWYESVLVKNGFNPEKITCIPQGLRSQASVPGWQKKEGTIRLVFVGRITRIKGLHLLIQALKELPKDSISLTVYGQCTEADYGTQCRKEAEGLNNICWKGSIPPDEVVQALARFDLLCLPSCFSEMSPLVIREAFAAGLPVVASNVYGNAEQINHNENGWLFQFGDHHSLRDCLAELIANPEKIKTAKASLPPMRSFSAVVADYEALYHKMLHEE